MVISDLSAPQRTRVDSAHAAFEYKRHKKKRANRLKEVSSEMMAPPADDVGFDLTELPFATL